MSPLDSRKVEAGSLGRRSPPWPPAPRQRLRMRGETRELVYETSKGAARGIAQCQDRTQVDTPGGMTFSLCSDSLASLGCWCYMKMSWGNCYVKVSWGAPIVEVSFPYGDLHDEPEGVAPGRLGQGRPRRTHHQSTRSQESAAERPAISALEAPPRDGRGRSAAPPEPWPAVVPPLARSAPHQGHDPHDHRLCGLQRCPSHGETARGRAPPAQP